jgi:hypothetical protein
MHWLSLRVIEANDRVIFRFGQSELSADLTDRWVEVKTLVNQFIQMVQSLL